MKPQDPHDDSTQHHATAKLWPIAYLLVQVVPICSYYFEWNAILITAAFIATAIGIAVVHTPIVRHRSHTCTICTEKILAVADNNHHLLPVYRTTHLLLSPVEWIARKLRLDPERHKWQIVIITPMMFWPSLIMPFIVPTPWKILGFIAPVFLIAKLFVIHNRYVMWCPMCRGGGGGNDDDTTDPRPQPTGSIPHLLTRTK